MRGANANKVSEKQRKTFTKDCHTVMGAMRSRTWNHGWMKWGHKGTHLVIKVRERVPEGVISRQDWGHSWGRGRRAGGNWYQKGEEGTSKAGNYKKT